MATRKTAAPAAPRPTSNVPALMVQQLADQLRANAEKVAPPSGNKIRFSKGNYVMPDSTEGQTFQAIILDFVSSNMYYKGKYDPKNIVPPDCFAIGPNPRKLVPSPNSPDLQSDSCETCPNNQFGSDGAGKACKNSRLIAVIPVGIDVEEGESPPIWVMSVPPTALKYFDGYVSGLASKSLVPIQVVTEFSLDDSTEYFAPRFKMAKAVDMEQLGEIFPLQAEGLKMVMVEPDVSSLKAAAPAAKGGKKPATRR